MYHQCEIRECNAQSVPRRVDTLDVESVIGLISSSTPAAVAAAAAANESSAAVVRLRHKAATH
jgi:hypothetical protein